MSAHLRVVSLQAQNILRLTAIDIKWDKDQSVLTLGGANGAGKSSAVNCVAMALGGKELCPEEPIKRGELKGFVELDLGELRIRRDFYRESLPCSCGQFECTDDCASHSYGDTKSRLVVRNADGIQQGTPQAILDKLIGRMTFDPMAFVNDEPRRQEEVLRRIVNLDVNQHEITRKTAFERRAVFNRQHKDLLAVIESMPHFLNSPVEETPISEITAELARVETLRQSAREVEGALTIAETALQNLRHKHDAANERFARLQQELDAAETDCNNIAALIVDKDAHVTSLKREVFLRRADVPDVAVINERLKETEYSNSCVRANRAYQKAQDDAARIAAQAEQESANIEAADAAKRAVLDAAQFPVSGLSLSDHGVTFNDLPFKQASTAEQIRVSVAIGFALHPKLKLLLVKNGNALDDDSLQRVATEAAAAGGQILMEYVTKDAADVSVFIEDGHQA